MSPLGRERDKRGLGSRNLERARELQAALDLRGVLAGEQLRGCIRDERRELRRVELGAEFEQRIQNGRRSGGISQRGFHGIRNARFIEKLHKAENLLLLGRTRELRQQRGDTRRTGLWLQRERGEQAGFDGKFLGVVRFEKLRDRLGMPLKEHADEEALVFPLVGFADFNGLIPVGDFGGGLGEGGIGESD